METPEHQLCRSIRLIVLVLHMHPVELLTLPACHKYFIACYDLNMLDYELIYCVHGSRSLCTVFVQYACTNGTGDSV